MTESIRKTDRASREDRALRIRYGVFWVLTLVFTCGFAQDSARELPRYGDLFPVATVDYYGLSSIRDYGPLGPVHSEALDLISRGRYDSANSLLDDYLEGAKSDLTAYVIWIEAADRADRIDEAVSGLKGKVASDIPNRKADHVINIAFAYATIVMVARSGRERSMSQVPYRQDIINNIVPKGRLQAMLVASIRWHQRDIPECRDLVGKFLIRDDRFYQLRTFYAHMFAHGRGPAKLGDGTIDHSFAVEADAAEVMRHAEAVIKSHPDYAPAYFVATATGDRTKLKNYLKFFVDRSHKDSEWHKRAVRALERLSR